MTDTTTESDGATRVATSSASRWPTTWSGSGRRWARWCAAQASSPKGLRAERPGGQPPEASCTRVLPAEMNGIMARSS